MATIKDVAREAGVAASTVSKYLNGGNVREENRQAIERAVEKLGYKVNFHAHAMRSGSSGLVLVMVPQFEDRHCCEIMQKARELLLQHGYIALLAETRCDQKKEQEILRRAIAHQVEGIISVHTEMTLPEYDELYQKKIPLVLIGRSYKRKHAGCVYFDDGEKFNRIFRHLKSNGHYNIGIVGGGLEKARLNSREFAYYLGLLGKAGLKNDEKYMYVSEGSSFETGINAALYFDTLPEPPTAIVCLNSEVLMGVYMALREQGYRVPDDVSLCVLARRSEFDQTPVGDFDAVVQPVEAAAERAVSLLLDNIKALPKSQGTTRTTVQLSTELHIGRTIAPAKNYTAPQ